MITVVSQGTWLSRCVICFQVTFQKLAEHLFFTVNIFRTSLLSNCCWRFNWVDIFGRSLAHWHWDVIHNKLFLNFVHKLVLLAFCLFVIGKIRLTKKLLRFSAENASLYSLLHPIKNASTNDTHSICF